MLKELEYPFDSEYLLKKSRSLKRRLKEDGSGCPDAQKDRGAGRFHHPRRGADAGAFSFESGD